MFRHEYSEVQEYNFLVYLDVLTILTTWELYSRRSENISLVEIEKFILLDLPKAN